VALGKRVDVQDGVGEVILKDMVRRRFSGGNVAENAALGCISHFSSWF
jgi:hypothetical protein